MGRAILNHPDLGEFDLDAPGSGICVADLTIGSAEVREVRRVRALADGEVDDSTFTGASIVSALLRINEDDCDGEAPGLGDVIDRLRPYLSPRYRPTLTFEWPRSSGGRRVAAVRGVEAPIELTGSRYPFILAQWQVPDGRYYGEVEQQVFIDPSGDTEAGRTYDLTFDRDYPFSLGIGDRLVRNAGNAVADYRATIFGEIDFPVLIINGTPIRFTRGDGLTLTGGVSVTIDTRHQTVWLNNDPNESRYARTNFTEWTWDAIRLRAGDNLVRLEGDPVGVGGSALIRYWDTYQ